MRFFLLKKNYLISDSERTEIEKELGKELQRIQERQIQANASLLTNEIRVTTYKLSIYTGTCSNPDG